jgi:hypothetical protein
MNERIIMFLEKLWMPVLVRAKAIAVDSHDAGVAVLEQFTTDVTVCTIVPWNPWSPMPHGTIRLLLDYFYPYRSPCQRYLGH